jgi:hypothetical protein
MKLFSDFNLSLYEIETMMPFERDLYVTLIIEEIEKRKQNANA